MVYGSFYTQPRLNDTVRETLVRLNPRILLYKAKIQYLITCKVSRYCPLALLGGYASILALLVLGPTSDLRI